MKYRNRQTGIVFDFSCPVSGEQWEPVVEEEQDAVEKPKKKAVRKNGGKG